jgi:hypothetical protein
MNNYDDYFGGLSSEEYEKESEKHFQYIEHICKCDDKKTLELLNRFKTNLFAVEYVTDEEAEMLYHTFLNWKEQIDMHEHELG